jgi:urea transport system substrate-binding protein
MSDEGGGFRRFALIGTDYVYPQITNTILSTYLKSQGLADSDVTVQFTPFGCDDWRAVVNRVRQFAKDKPTAIISTINGDANIFFFRELRAQGITAAQIPVMAFSVGENEAAAFDKGLLTGHYMAWNYFSSIETPQSQMFVERWRRHLGDDTAITDDPMEATWLGFQMWCRAVENAGTIDIDAVRAALSGLQLMAPSGMQILMDPENHHLHKPAMIGKITADGRISVVFKSPGLIPPDPFSPHMSGCEEHALALRA